MNGANGALGRWRQWGDVEVLCSFGCDVVLNATNELEAFTCPNTHVRTASMSSGARERQVCPAVFAVVGGVAAAERRGCYDRRKFWDWGQYGPCLPPPRWGVGTRAATSRSFG